MLQVPDVIVEAKWLYEQLDHPNLVVLDATIKKVGANESTNESQEFIPNSIFFDLKSTFSNLESPLPNTVLSHSEFESEVRQLGIHNNSCIVVYDALGIYSSPRVFWLFRLMGFDNIAVLNGGFPTWTECGFPSATQRKSIKEKGNFTANYSPKLFSSVFDVKKALSDQETLIIDARGKDRFLGLVEEPRKGLRSGHIPNSLNIPYTKVLKNGKLASKEYLEPLFEDVVQKNVIFSCGSGITACVLALATEYIGSKDYSVFDGSWTEWGSDINLPIER